MDWLDWVLLVARVVVVFFVLLVAVILYVWMERKVIADFQTRAGPLRAGPRGMFVTIADLNVGVLWILAMTSLGVYAIVLAGWSSGSNYPLLGAVRSSAQMISYEVAMGLALVAVLMYSGTLKMSAIVASQDTVWNVIPQFPAFVIYLVAGVAG